MREEYRMIRSILSIPIHLRMWIFIFTVILLNGSLVWAEEDRSVLWEKLRSGEHFVMIRHALAPGMGDPATFTINKCETQRNLSQQGRDQARYIGELFRKNGISAAQIYSSQWCRCLDTAKLLGLGTVKELPILNSFFKDFDNEIPQTEALAQWLRKQYLTTTMVLVTHQVNITAFTDIYPGPGEMVIVHRQKNGHFDTVGTIETY